MPKRPSKGVKGAYIEFVPDLLADMKALAGRNRRTLREEMESACRRHLAAPPIVTLTVSEEAADLPEEEVRVPAARTAKGRARKAK